MKKPNLPAAKAVAGRALCGTLGVRLKNGSISFSLGPHRLSHRFAWCALGFLLYCGAQLRAESPWLWRYENTNQFTGMTALVPAIAPDGTIYWPSGGHLDALTPAGVLKWRFSPAFPDSALGAFVQTPTIRSDGVVLVSTDSRWSETNFFAIRSDGSVAWTAPWSASSIAQGRNGTFIMDRVDKEVFIRRIDTRGRVQWSRQLTNALPFRYGPEQLFIGPEGNLYAEANGITAYTQLGERLWYPPIGAGVGGITEDGTLYATSVYEVGAFSLDPTGKLKQFLPARWVFGFLPSGNLLGLRPFTNELSIQTELLSITPAGEILWTNRSANAVDTSATVAADGTAYLIGVLPVDNGEHYLRAITADGRIVRETRLPEALAYGAPIIGPDGTVYVGAHLWGAEGKFRSALFAFRGVSPLSQVNWPAPGRDAANTRSMEELFYGTAVESSVTRTSAVLRVNVRSLIPDLTADLQVGDSTNALKPAGTALVKGPANSKLLEFTVRDLQSSSRYYYQVRLSGGGTEYMLPIHTFETGGPTEDISPTYEALRLALISGGRITFNSAGVISFTNALEIRSDTTIEGHADGTVLDGHGQSDIFSIEDADVTLSSLHFANASKTGAPGRIGICVVYTNAEPALGGAIFASNATLRVQSCTFSNSVARGGAGAEPFGNCETALPAAGFGGALYLSHSDATIAQTIFDNCLARGGEINAFGLSHGFGRGGAIAAFESTLKIDACRFMSNNAPSAGARYQIREGKGGAILLSGTAAIVETSQFARNSSGTGGAIFTDSALTLRDCTFDGNSVWGAGGGIVGEPQAGLGGAICNASTNTLALSDCSVTRNGARGGSAGYYEAGPSLGGGIYSFPGLLTLTNSTVALNEVLPPFKYPNIGHVTFGRATGAGIYCSNAIVEYSTVASNFVNLQALPPSFHGPRVDVEGIFSLGGSVLLHAVILSNEGTNASGTFIDSGYNLSSDNSVTFSEPTSRASIDSRLRPFQLDDGFLGYFRVRPDSPAIDAGDPTQFPLADLRGVPRPIGVGPDIGAIEFTPDLELLVRAEGNRLILSFSAPSPAPITIESSTDLSTWSLLTTNSPQGTLSIDLAEKTHRFYRLKQATPVPP